ncbi:hypothetical protein E2C01_039863 [Portunus trituberculatus]|uniref:Uncharacterized protein n=1 Tax=Portunus trituberculatus TaxID=210409 RepID=A0A5B7FL52_PORTR|nr:hypothetical protein [Portunus trituberculatus]
MQCGIKVSPYAIEFAIGTMSCLTKPLAIRDAKGGGGGEEKNMEKQLMRKMSANKRYEKDNNDN